MDTWTDGDDDGVATDKWYRLLRRQADVDTCSSLLSIYVQQ